MANQLEWARKQMDLEVPEQTVAGNDIQGREDFVRQACDSQCGRVDGLLTQAAAPHLTGRPRAAVPRPPPHRAQYIASEREKFGREVDNATAEREVDEWLLKQARPCPSRPAGLATACLPDGQAGAPAAAATRLAPCACAGHQREHEDERGRHRSKRAGLRTGVWGRYLPALGGFESLSAGRGLRTHSF